jgi:two-component system sensor histidine kinase AlgZ
MTCTVCDPGGPIPHGFGSATVHVMPSHTSIEKIRLGDRLSVEFHVASAALPARVPHLLLQPLVENAIRHGIAPRTTGGRLMIRIERQGGDVLITLRNDCDEARTDTRGIGLTNTAARLDQFYGRAHQLTLRSPAAGEFEVQMRLPFR